MHHHRIHFLLENVTETFNFPLFVVIKEQSLLEKPIMVRGLGLVKVMFSEPLEGLNLNFNKPSGTSL